VKFRTAFKVSALTAAIVVAAGFAAGPAFAADGGTSPSVPPSTDGLVQIDSAGFPHAEKVLPADALKKIGAGQTKADMDKIIAKASPTQNVQLLLDFDTKSYGGAVLVNQSADAQLADVLAKGGSAPAVATQNDATASPAGVLAGIYNCSYTSGPKGTSSHGSYALYWCGSGSWSGGGITPWDWYRNGIATNALVGPSNLSWMVCPGYTTCTVSPSGTPLGYVSFN